MKKAFFLFSLVLLGIGGCGHDEENLHLEILLPVSLTKNETRYRQFLTRASHLRVECIGKGGWNYPVSEWGRMPLPAIPLGDGEKVKVRVQIWDRTRAGHLRTYPVLAGEATTDKEKLATSLGTLAVKLSLRVSVAEYD